MPGYACDFFLPLNELQQSKQRRIARDPQLRIHASSVRMRGNTFASGTRVGRLPAGPGAQLELDGDAADHTRRRPDHEELVVERRDGIAAAMNQVADAEHELDLRHLVLQVRDALIDLQV